MAQNRHLRSADDNCISSNCTEASVVVVCFSRKSQILRARKSERPPNNNYSVCSLVLLMMIQLAQTSNAIIPRQKEEDSIQSIIEISYATTTQTECLVCFALALVCFAFLRTELATLCWHCETSQLITEESWISKLIVSIPHANFNAILRVQKRVKRTCRWFVCWQANILKWIGPMDCLSRVKFVLDWNSSDFVPRIKISSGCFRISFSHCLFVVLRFLTQSIFHHQMNRFRMAAKVISQLRLRITIVCVWWCVENQFSRWIETQNADAASLIFWWQIPSKHLMNLIR